MTRLGTVAGFAIVALSMALMSDAKADMLISAQEAALPSASAAGITFRSVTRGPKVQLVSPPDASVVHSPVALHLKFESYGGATIDPASVKVTYMKKPAVDLTARVKTYIRPDGVDMETAEIPPGEHIIKVDVTDSQGRAGSSTFTLKVDK